MTTRNPFWTTPSPQGQRELDAAAVYGAAVAEAMNRAAPPSSVRLDHGEDWFHPNPLPATTAPAKYSTETVTYSPADLERIIAEVLGD